jgi:hypothetical protein
MPQFDWTRLISLLPVIVTAVNPGIAPLATALAAIGEQELARMRTASPGLTDDQIIAQAQADWDKAQADAEALLAEGHENDTQP